MNRRIRLTRADHLPAKQWRRLWAGFDQLNDPHEGDRGRRAVKERLRMLLAQCETSQICWVLLTSTRR